MSQSVLIIEDDIQDQEKLIKCCKLLNFQHIDSCIGGLTAVEFFEKNTYNLVLLDMRLAEGTSGLDVLEYLVKSKIYMPVLIVSGHLDSFKNGLVKYLTEEYLLIETLDKNIPNIDIATNIKKFIDQYTCYELRTFKIPEMVDNINNLETKVKTLEETSINNFDFSVEFKNYLKMGLAKHGKLLVMGVFSLAGLAISLIQNKDITKYLDNLLKILDKLLFQW